MPFIRRNQGVYINHPLGKDDTVPDSLPEERVLQLTKKLRSNQILKSEFDELARGYIKSGIKVAGKYARIMPNKTEDFVSCAMFGIVWALERGKERLTDDNLSPWVISCMHRFCQEFLQEDSTIRVPSRTRRQKSIETVKTVNFGGFQAEMDYDDLKGIYTKKIIKPEAKPEEVSLELKDALFFVATTEEDSQILRLKAEGYTEIEVGSLIQKSQTYVSRRIATIRERFDRL